MPSTASRTSSCASRRPAFPEADLEFYDRARRELEGKGYTFVADVEDLTLSRIYPHNRTFLRLFVDAGRMIRASVYHLHPRGVVISLLQLVQLFPRHLRVIELVQRGRRHVPRHEQHARRRSARAAAGGEGRAACRSALPSLEVVARHETRITELLREHPERAPVSFESFEDVLASIARAHVAMARHRQKVGGLSRDELERLKGRPLSRDRGSVPARGPGQARPQRGE